MNKTYHRLLLAGILVVSMFPLVLVADPWPVIPIDTGFRMQLLDGQVGVLQVEEELSFSEVSSVTPADFEFNASTNFLFGLTDEAHWLKYQLLNTGTEVRQLLMEVVNPNLTQIIHFQVYGGQLMQLDSVGTDYSFSHRPVKHQNFLLPITLPVGDTLTGWLRLAPMAQPVNFNLFCWDREERLTRQTNRETVWLVGFFQVNLILLALVFMTALVFKVRALWYYGIYVMLGALLVFVDLGLGYRYLWPQSSYWQRSAGFLFINLYLICGIQFIRHYFKTYRRRPRFDKIFLGSIAVTLVFLIMAVALPYLPLGFAHFLSRAHYGLYLLCSATFVLLFLRDLPARHQYAGGWFLAAFSLHGLGIVATLLQYLGLIPVYSVAEWLLAINWPVTFYTQVLLMGGMILEIPIVIYVAYRTFSALLRRNQQQASKLARLRQDNMQALVVGMETERRRLAQDLHDGLGVNLAALKMKANLMEVQAAEEVRPQWQDIMRDVEGVYDELRHIVHNLPPRSLFQTGLQQALRETVEKTRLLQPQLQIEFHYHLPAQRPSPEAEAHLYRIVLELMNNVLQHAEASELVIQLTCHQNREILLTVEDNGKGLSPQEGPGKGVGLHNIRHRVGLLDGRFSIDSYQGQGATMVVEIPYHSVFPE